jgi:hypothetical protein
MWCAFDKVPNEISKAMSWQYQPTSACRDLSQTEKQAGFLSPCGQDGQFGPALTHKCGGQVSTQSGKDFGVGGE